MKFIVVVPKHFVDSSDQINYGLPVALLEEGSDIDAYIRQLSINSLKDYTCVNNITHYFDDELESVFDLEKFKLLAGKTLSETQNFSKLSKKQLDALYESLKIKLFEAVTIHLSSK